MTRFIGREEELFDLKLLLKKKSASLVVIRGRRRIGKSRIAEEFSQKFPKKFIFSGLPPDEGITDRDQKEEFVRLLKQQGIRFPYSDDWGDLFWTVAQNCQKGRVLVVLDEITWMGMDDHTFLGKLKNAWDLEFKKNPKLVLIISGSNSAWIERNILSSKVFFGRISLQLTLKELPINDCDKFWGSQASKISSYEKFKLLAVTGGIPRYLEEIHPEMSAEENILRLCYRPSGLLFGEFDKIFSELFTNRSSYYQKIVAATSRTSQTLIEISMKLGREKGGDLSKCLENLVMAGFLARDYTWHVKSGQKSHLSRYRLSDNYLRFYLRYIEPLKDRIPQKPLLKEVPIGWTSIMGLQFENLVVNHADQLIELLHIPSNEIVYANPYWQRVTHTHRGCQIDYLIQTRFGTIYLCEIKFSKAPVDTSVIDEIEDKIKALVLPKGFSIRPVLIHVNGVAESLLEREYLAHIINFGAFLESS